MWYILLGLVGFGFIAAAECISQRAVGLLKPFLWLASASCLAGAIFLAWIDSPRFLVPPIVSVVSWACMICFGALFVYSAFLEVPFRSSYLERSERGRLVTGGTYALTRHPGVLWNTIFSVAMVLASGSVVLAVATPFWVAANVGCVYLEEKVNLEKAFGGEYWEYQTTTPMLVPTKASILRFLKVS
ncbi:MAG: methyltransferase [Chloroflexota bacterium]